MTRVQYTVNGLALLALAVGLAVYDIRTLGCLLIEDRPRNPRLQLWGTVNAAAIIAALGDRPGRAHLRTLADRLDRCARICWQQQHPDDDQEADKCG